MQNRIERSRAVIKSSAEYGSEVGKVVGGLLSASAGFCFVGELSFNYIAEWSFPFLVHPLYVLPVAAFAAVVRGIVSAVPCGFIGYGSGYVIGRAVGGAMGCGGVVLDEIVNGISICGSNITHKISEARNSFFQKPINQNVPHVAPVDTQSERKRHKK